MKMHQEPPRRRGHTRRILSADEEGDVTEPLAHDEDEAGTAITESILDNLSGWAVVAVLIGLLYLVWVTLEILSKYMGGIPSVGA